VLVLFVGRCWCKAATVQAMNLVTGGNEAASNLVQPAAGGVGDRYGRCERFERQVVTSVQSDGAVQASELVSVQLAVAS